VHYSRPKLQLIGCKLIRCKCLSPSMCWTSADRKNREVAVQCFTQENGVRVDHVENWDINAPQTEEEAGESFEALSLELDWSKDITIANDHAYRVTRSRAPFPAAVSSLSFLGHSLPQRSRECRKWICHVRPERLRHTFLRVSKFPYENSIEDVTNHLDTREREFAMLDIPDAPPTPASADASAVLEPGSKVQKVADGFVSIFGAVVAASGKLYFVDHHEQRMLASHPRNRIQVRGPFCRSIVGIMANSRTNWTSTPSFTRS
jgi:hypothetical protein